MKKPEYVKLPIPVTGTRLTTHPFSPEASAILRKKLKLREIEVTIRGTGPLLVVEGPVSRPLHEGCGVRVYVRGRGILATPARS